MPEILVILIFIGVIVITALIFGVWVIATVFRLIFRIIGGISDVLFPSNSTRPPMQIGTRGVICPAQQCRANNPGGARFCRRCGRELPIAQHVNVRRAAMW